MRLLISLVDSDDPFATGSLYAWLKADAAEAQVTLSHQDIRNGTMGALEIIDVVMANTLAAASLFVAVRAWLQSRPVPGGVRFTIGNIEIVAKDATPETLEAAKRALLAVMPDEPA